MNKLAYLSLLFLLLQKGDIAITDQTVWRYKTLFRFPRKETVVPLSMKLVAAKELVPPSANHKRSLKEPAYLWCIKTTKYSRIWAFSSSSCSLIRLRTSESCTLFIARLFTDSHRFLLSRSFRTIASLLAFLSISSSFFFSAWMKTR